MKIKLLAAFAILALSSFIPSGQAAEKGDPKVELKAIVEKVQAKLKEGKKTEADLAENFKEFDDLLAEHKGEKTDDVSQILMMKAMLYIQVLDNPEKGTALITQLQKEYPDTKNGKNADKILDSLKKQAESKKIRAELVEGAKFPDFTEKDLAGKPLSIANYKGKVVLLDFWATWCGPCKAELPNVIKTYEAHHGKGFEIIGISLDDSEDKLTAYIKEKNMTWQQYFDGKGWGNKLAQKYGVQSIPATYLLDGEGKIIGANLRGEALESAVTKALAKK